MNVWEILFGAEVGGNISEARKKVSLDPKANLKMPDPVGIADAGQVVSTLRPGQTTKDNSRRTRYSDFDLMDIGDIEAMLDATVDAAISFDEDDLAGFKLDGTKRNALNILKDLTDITDLRQKLPSIARDLLKYGDSFIEHLDDGQGSIIRLQSYYPNQIFVTMDAKGNLDRTKAYTQIDAQSKEVASWAPDEMIHFKWWPSDREPYSVKSVLDGLRDDWGKLQELEAGMILARKTRAYPRGKHFIDVTNRTPEGAREKVRNYIRAITRSEPFRATDGLLTVTRTDMGVNEDFFLPTGMITAPDGSLHARLDNVEMLDPNLNGLSEIADVEYLRRKMFCRIPADIVGIATGTADLAHQNIAYARLVRHLQRRLEDGLSTLAVRALLLRGVSPDRIEFVWPEIVSGQNWKFADAKFRQSMTDQVDIETGLYSSRQKLRYRGHTEEEIDRILEEIRQEQDLKVAAPQSRGAASQAGIGAASGDSVNHPGPNDTAATLVNRAQQPATKTNQ